MKDLRRQARVTAFLRSALAEAPQDVVKLEAMARTEGLLGDRQRITHAKPFKRGKHSLRIRSVRAGFGTDGGWRWELPCDRDGVSTVPLLRASQFAQSRTFQSVGSRGSTASTSMVHQLTSHGTVGVSL